MKFFRKHVVLSLCLSFCVLASYALSAKPGGVDHRGRQNRPIQLGTSGGNARDIANGFCCSGTLGALVQIAGQQYILSNTHVLAGDSALGGNGRVSTAGDPVNQPGLVDVSCQDRPADYVANLSSWAPLADGVVDAAIAEVIPGAVDPSGAILEIGALSSSTAAAFPGQRVKKSGRTTGLTNSVVDAINATVNVQYSDECAGSNFVTTFTGQIIVRNRGSRFLNSGDSGSLLVENISSNPRAVGLLYAGSSSLAVANRIDDVLNYFGASMVGVLGAGASTSEPASGQLQRDVARAIRLQQLNAHVLSNVPRGVGHAVGIGDNAVVIKIFVEEITPEALSAAPREIDGVPVVLEAVGRIVAF